MSDTETEAHYANLNPTEKHIVDGWIAGGMSKAQAINEFLATVEDIDGDMGL